MANTNFVVLRYYSIDVLVGKLKYKRRSTSLLLLRRTSCTRSGVMPCSTRFYLSFGFNKRCLCFRFFWRTRCTRSVGTY